MPQLSIQLVDQSVHVVRVDRPCTIGGPSTDPAVPALGDLTLHVVPRAAGIVIASTDSADIGARHVAAGTSWLLRNGERAMVRGASLLVLGDPPPDGTRELAGALLAGLDPSPPCGPGLLVLEGPDAGRRFPMGQPTLVGRGLDADLALDDPLVSRRHLRLERRGDVFVARDVASKNGVLVNGRRGARARLRAGDELRIGATLLVLDDPSASVSPPAERRRLVDDPSLDDASPGVGSTAAPLRAREVTAIVLASSALLAGALLLARAAG